MSGRQTFKLWANVYRSLNGAMGSVWASRELADQMAGRGRIACVEFDARDGLAAASGTENKEGGQ